MRELLRKLYREIPFKREAFSLVKCIGTPPHWIFKHLSFVGIFQTEVEGKPLKLHHFGFELENAIFWKGMQSGWEGVSMSLWIALCKEAHFILDIGANTGIYALVAKTVNPSAEVSAFEPVSRVYRKLVQNCDINGLDIHCIRKAASNKNGRAIIFDPQGEHVYSVTVNRNLNPPEVATKEVEIETISLATFLDSFASPPLVDLIKIDVETHEPEVLEGMGPHLQRVRPSILIEVLNEDVARRLASLLRGLDYLYFNIDESGRPKLQKELTASAHSNFLICSASKAKGLRLI